MRNIIKVSKLFCLLFLGSINAAEKAEFKKYKNIVRHENGNRITFIADLAECKMGVKGNGGIVVKATYFVKDKRYQGLFCYGDGFIKLQPEVAKAYYESISRQLAKK